MKIVSIDIRTTSSQVANAQVLEFGAVGFNTEIDEFTPVVFSKRFVIPKTTLFSLKAVQVNKFLIDDMDAFKKNRLEKEKVDQYVKINTLVDSFWNWLYEEQLLIISERPLGYETVLTGERVDSFILPVLAREDQKWLHIANRRVIDPSTCYALPTDIAPPSIQECKKRSGLFTNNNISETSLDRAMDIAKLIHNYFTFKETF